MKISRIPKKSCFNYFKFFIIITVIFVSSYSLQSQWVRLNSGISSQLLTVNFINQNTGFAGGLHGQILKTTDGGMSWQANTVIDTSAVFCSFYFLNENTGYATGGLFAFGTNKFLSTTNGGLNWLINSFIEPGYLEEIKFQNINTGFALNLYGYIYKSTNSGVNWNIINHLPYYTFSMTFNNTNIGYIAGGNMTDSMGLIYKTIDGGNNWITAYSDRLGIINSILFVNANTGFAAGQREYTFGPVSARIIKTTDSGINWYIDTLFSNISGLGSLFFTDENTGYAVGSNGAIFKTTTGGNPLGVNNIWGEIPSVYLLYQNYPNPFNPNTNIKYQIAKSSTVNLVIYNVQGKEVKTLVNSYQKEGTYEVSFDASNLPSGIYFYRLEVRQAGSSTGDYVETKKMVLVK